MVNLTEFWLPWISNSIDYHNRTRENSRVDFWPWDKSILNDRSVYWLHINRKLKESSRGTRSNVKAGELRQHLVYFHWALQLLTFNSHGSIWSVRKSNLSIGELEFFRLPLLSIFSSFISSVYLFLNYCPLFFSAKDVFHLFPGCWIDYACLKSIDWISSIWSVKADTDICKMHCEAPCIFPHFSRRFIMNLITFLLFGGGCFTWPQDLHCSFLQKQQLFSSTLAMFLRRYPSVQCF